MTWRAARSGPAVGETQRDGNAGPELLLPVVDWCAWGLDADPAAPDVTFIDPALRRRLGPMARSALSAAERIRPHKSPVRVVFASRHGELRRNAEMLEELADGQTPSPMNFSLSVLNAVAGLYAIARRDTSATTAVSAGHATVPLALLEGAAQAWTYPREAALVVCADEPAPPLFADLVQEPARPCALAVLMNARDAKRMVKATRLARTGAVTSASALAAVVDCLSSGQTVEWNTVDHGWRFEPDAAGGH